MDNAEKLNNSIALLPPKTLPFHFLKLYPLSNVLLPEERKVGD
jgi:hypothetical protein